MHFPEDFFFCGRTEAYEHFADPAEDLDLGGRHLKSELILFIRKSTVFSFISKSESKCLYA